MEREGRSITSFLFGAAVGVAVGYLLATDKETRKEDMGKIKNAINKLKGKFSKTEPIIDEDIYHS